MLVKRAIKEKATSTIWAGFGSTFKLDATVTIIKLLRAVEIITRNELKRLASKNFIVLRLGRYG